jgi:iron complex transport system substrate-binding protein
VKIVSLLPSATEILFGIGASEEVVGVTHECDYPPEALELPKLTSASTPGGATSAEIDRHVRAAVHAGSSLYHLDSALLAQLEPDLIVTQELCAVCAVSYEIVDSAAKLLNSCHPERSNVMLSAVEARRTRVISLEPASLQDVFANIATLGEMTGHAKDARSLLAKLESRVAALRIRTAGRAQRPRTLVLEWTDPPMSAGHWIPELVELAGGVPVLANPGANSQRLEWAAIAQAGPEAIIVAPCGFDLAKTRRAVAELDAVETWRSLAAQRAGRVLALDGNAYLSRPGPRLVDAAEIVQRWYTSGAEYAG